MAVRWLVVVAMLLLVGPPRIQLRPDMIIIGGGFSGAPTWSSVPGTLALGGGGNGWIGRRRSILQDGAC